MAANLVYGVSMSYLLLIYHWMKNRKLKLWYLLKQKRRARFPKVFSILISFNHKLTRYDPRRHKNVWKPRLLRRRNIYREAKKMRPIKIYDTVVKNSRRNARVTDWESAWNRIPLFSIPFFGFMVTLLTCEYIKTPWVPIVSCDVERY